MSTERERALTDIKQITDQLKEGVNALLEKSR
jgi:hypothetical protein